MPADLVGVLTTWFEVHGRELPWRSADRTPWGVLVSEVMLQQTPVARVVPAWNDWMGRWPDAASLAAATPGQAVRQWDRLGYPRRAIRLHECAVALVERHGGTVPDTDGALRALPGVGEYTSAAVRAFAFGQRSVVLDTNVRRVLGRVVGGEATPAPSVTVAERRRAESLIPDGGPAAARWSAAVMELGALVCSASSLSCGRCPVTGACTWVRLGRPASTGPRRRTQGFEGTDRQVRGRIMAVLRSAAGPVDRAAVEGAWSDGPQRARALAGLVADGLVEPVADGRFGLPGESRGETSGTPPA